MAKAVWIPKAAPPEVMELRSAADPTPRAGEVTIRVRASGVNFADVSARLGFYPDAPPFPCVVGYEVSGTVDAVGTGVGDLRPGQRVGARMPGRDENQRQREQQQPGVAPVTAPGARLRLPPTHRSHREQPQSERNQVHRQPGGDQGQHAREDRQRGKQAGPEPRQGPASRPGPTEPRQRRGVSARSLRVRRAGDAADGVRAEELATRLRGCRP